MVYGYTILHDGTMIPHPIDTQLPENRSMPLAITKTFTFSKDELKDIIIKYLCQQYNLSGIFDITFKLADIDCDPKLVGVKVDISENENI